MSVVFIDGTGITPGTEDCKCGNDCDFPCWQRLGWAPACEMCGCEIDTGYKAPGIEIGPLHFQRNAWGGLWCTLTLWRPRRWSYDK